MILDKNKMIKDYRLKDLIRYNTRTKITNESVAEHSFYVIMYTLELCRYFKLDDKITSKAMALAVVHDMPEIDLCDIPHDIKVNNPKLLEEYQKVEDRCLNKLYDRFEIKDVDNKSIEYRIVKIADLYSVIQYCNHEKILGNKSSYLNIVLTKTNKIINSLEEDLKNILGGNKCQ